MMVSRRMETGYAVPMSIETMLEGWPVRYEVPVAWGQMDAFAHVNNTVYFRWFEDVRLAVFVRVGWQVAIEQGGVGPILARTQCVFKRPLAWPDTVTIGAKIEDLSEDRFSMLYRVVSHSLGEVAAEGDARVISFDYGAGRKAPIPDEIHRALAAL